MSAEVTPLATGATPVFGLPYPDDSEAAAGSDQMQALAEATDTAIAGRVAKAGDTMTGNLQHATGTGVYWPTADRFIYEIGTDLAIADGTNGSPVPLLVGAPTIVNHTARWADGVPRFANAIARDSAYLTIGGPVEGMRCYISADKTSWIYDGTTWIWVASARGESVSIGISGNPGGLPVGWTTVPFTGPRHIRGTQLTWSSAGITVGKDGLYLVSGAVGLEGTGGIHIQAQMAGLTPHPPFMFGSINSSTVNGYSTAGATTVQIAAGNLVQMMVYIGGTSGYLIYGDQTTLSVTRLA